MSVADLFFIDIDDLEGIAIRRDEEELLLVQEATNSLVEVDLMSRRKCSRRPLSAMSNYDTIADCFPDPPDHNGLEGITVNTSNDNVFVVKEQRPGLLIEACIPSIAGSNRGWAKDWIVQPILKVRKCWKHRIRSVFRIKL